jgi:hypothetical protein
MIRQLQSFLKDIKNRKDKLGEITDLEDKKTCIISILEGCLRILDYTASNFPNIKENMPKKKNGNVEVYFPRPFPSESSKVYFRRIRNSYNQADFHPFIKKAYIVICKYKKSISYIDSNIKHELPPDLPKEKKRILNYSIRSTNPNPVKINDKGFRIGNMGFGGNIRMQNCVFHDDQGTTIVDELDSRIELVEGNKINLRGGVQLELDQWLNDCINTCSEIINIFNKYFPKQGQQVVNN